MLHCFCNRSCAYGIFGAVVVKMGKINMCKIPVKMTSVNIHTCLRGTVPHECDDPKCPGNVNRQIIEMYPELVDRLRDLCFVMPCGHDCQICPSKILLERASALQEARQ